EDPGRVRGLSGRPQGPGGHAAPGDGGRVADGCLEGERRIGLLRRRDEMTAADLEGLAGILLVAGEVYGDPAVPQGPSVVERAQCREDDHVAALHVARPDSPCAASAADEPLALDDRVEVSDEEDP